MNTTTVWQGAKWETFRDYGSVDDSAAQIADRTVPLVDLSLRPPFVAIWPSEPEFGGINVSLYSALPDRRFVNGRSCIVLRKIDGGLIETEICVDPSVGYLVQRVIGKAGDNIDRQFDVEYQRDDRVGWVPAAWHLVVATQGTGEPSLQIDSRVTSLTPIARVDESEFEIRFPAGMVVVGTADRGATHTLDVVQDNGELRPREDPHTVGQRAHWLILAANAAAVLALVVFVCWRRRVRGRASAKR